ncbi:DUF456 domain-containing protein [Rummeliibacillus stabekisii]|uniref:DUF456 domain-containing protein n=1 Tax=Rummeliibacillus stabekisii TaxID=241244 RepID=UPI00203DBAF7|nr:DUF456 domain-containing protein [Rummeliibacillus stabekisii]MCM3316206.1 DUF456 domain-containing protein [Rummeliibacillus stabekisii]
MEFISWTLVIASFIVAMVGLVYPIIPSVLFIFLGFIIRGLFHSFSELPWWFWVIEVLFTLLLFGADTLANAFGVKRFGGSEAGIWGSTIGLLVGPFVIPFAGILIGPFIGAVLAELIFKRTSLKTAFKAGIGSLVGFLTSVFTKGVIQIIMIIIFVMVV